MLTAVLSETGADAPDPLYRGLADHPALEALAWAQDGVEAAQLALSLHPHLLLADERLAGLPGLQVCRFVSRACPQVACVLVSDRADAAFLREAMSFGARAVLSPHTAPAEALRALDRLARHTRVDDRPEYARVTDPARMPFTIAALSPQDGPYLSFLLCNLAALLAAAAPDDTVLVDWRPQGGVAADLLGLRPRHALADLASYGEQADAEVVNLALVRHPAGFHLLPGAVAPDRAWVQPLTRGFAAQLLGTLRTRFRYLLCHLPPTLGPAELYLCRHAQRLLLFTPLTEPGALRSALQLHGLLRAQGLADRRLRLLPARVTPADRADLQEFARLTHLTPPLQLPEDPAVDRALRAGELFALSHRRSPAAQALHELATLLQQDLPALTPAPPPADTREGEAA